MILSCQDFWLDVFPGMRLKCPPRARRERASRRDTEERFARRRRMQNFYIGWVAGKAPPGHLKAPSASPTPTRMRAKRRTPERARSRLLSVRAKRHTPERARSRPAACSRCARSAARLALQRARSSPAECPELKRAGSLGRSDHDRPRRWRPTRTDRTGACDLTAQRGRP